MKDKNAKYIILNVNGFPGSGIMIDEDAYAVAATSAKSAALKVCGYSTNQLKNIKLLKEKLDSNVYAITGKAIKGFHYDQSTTKEGCRHTSAKCVDIKKDDVLFHYNMIRVKLTNTDRKHFEMN